MKSGIKSADLNLVWHEKPLKSADQKTIRLIKKDFMQIGLPFWWWIFPVAKSALTVRMLKTEGFSFVESVPSMLSDLSSLPVQENRAIDVSITQVRSLEELALWEEISFSGFEFLPETRNQYHKFLQSFDLKPNAPQKFFLAGFNGKFAATSLLFLHGNAAGLYFITTLPGQRKQGIGFELINATLRFAKASGALFATLQSSPDGLHVYQRSGFKEFCKVDVYSTHDA